MSFASNNPISFSSLTRLGLAKGFTSHFYISIQMGRFKIAQKFSKFLKLKIDLKTIESWRTRSFNKLHFEIFGGRTEILVKTSP